MSKEAKKLEKTWLDEGDIMIRRPSDDEQRAGKIQTSDYQISSLTIQTKIMSCLELIDRVYRTKITTIEKSKANKIKKYKSIIKNLFYYLKYVNTTDDFYVALREDKEMSEKMGFDIKLILKSQKSWEKVLTQSHILPIIVTFVKENQDSEEYTEEEVAICKRNYIEIYDFLKKQSERYENPALYFSALSYIKSFNSILRDDFMNGVMEDIMDFPGTFDDLKNFIFHYLDTKNVGSVKRHTQTVVNELCQDSQNEIREIIIRDGIGDKLTLPNYISYLENYKPAVITNFIEECGVDIRNYTTFDELCDALYSPDIISQIRNGLNVKIRARSTGDIRKGAELIIEQKRFISKYENAKKKLGDDIADYNPDDANFNIEIKKKILDEKKDDLDKKKDEYEELRNLLRNARSIHDSSSVAYLKNKLRNKEEEIRQTNKIYKTLKRDYVESKNKTKAKNRAYEIYKQYKMRELEMIQNMKDERVYEDLYELDVMEKKIKSNLLDEDFIPYFTWRFVCSEMDDDTANTICESLEKYLNDKNGVCGESGYINATPHQFQNGPDRLTQFFIDYPKSAAIYKAFEKKGINLSNILVKGFADCLKKDIKYIEEETYFNIPMEKTLSNDDEDTFWN